MLPLICIDVDGTLIGTAGEPSAAVWAAADAAVARGQHLALCTARAAFGPTWGYAERLDPAGWHVFHAGSAIVHTGTGEVRQQVLPDEVIEQCLALAAERGWTLEKYAARAYAVSDDSPIAVGHAGLMGVELGFRPFAEITDPVPRMQFIVPVDDARLVLDAGLVGAEVTAATSPAQPEAAFVSVTPIGVTKATAIAQIIDGLGATMADVMMVGDGHNDVEAMKAVGHAVAMGNAVEECRAVSDYQVGHVDADGLVEALELSATL